MQYLWRPMAVTDLPQVMAIAERVHVGYFEAEEVFAERLARFPHGCRMAVARDGGACGYAIMHPWHLGQPPALNRLLGDARTVVDCLHLHDIALLPATRGAGLGRGAVDFMRTVMREEKLPHAALVAVHGSMGYWRNFGFEPWQNEARQLREYLRSYGEGAVYMSMAAPASNV